MEQELLDSLDESITTLIVKLQKWKTIEVSDILRTDIITELKWLQRSIKEPRFLTQLNNVLSTLFPNVSDMRSAFEIIDKIDEFQKDALIKTLVFYVIKPESETQRYKKLQSIMRSIHGHICTMIKHNQEEIFITKEYLEGTLFKFFNKNYIVDIFSWLGLTEGLMDDNGARIKFHSGIEQALFDLDYFKKVNDKIQIQPKFTESCLFRLWLSWLAVNRYTIKYKWFITGFCSVFADIILGASLPSIAPKSVDSKIRNSSNYDENTMEIKPPMYSQKEVVIDVLYHLARYVAYQFGGDGWVNSIQKAGSAQGSILSTAFREEIKGQPAVKRNAIYVRIQEIMVQIRTRFPSGP